MNLKDAFWNEGSRFECDLPKITYREFNDDIELSNDIDVVSVVDVDACIEKYGTNEVFVTCDGSSWYFVPASIVTFDESKVMNTEVHKGISVEVVDVKINIGTGERSIDKITQTVHTFTIHWCKWLRRGNWE